MADADATAVEVDPRAREEFIVDTDFHAGPSSDLAGLLPYVDDERLLRKFAVHHRLPNPKRTNTRFAKMSPEGYHTHGVATTTEEVAAVMERFAIDQPIVAPGTNALPAVKYPRVKEAICRAVNDYLLDRIVDDAAKVKTHLALPIWNAEACVAELDRLGDERDVVGGYAWYGPFSPSLGEPQYDPVFEALVERDLPLAIHVGGSTMAPVDLVGESMRTRMETLGLLNAFYAMADCANLVATGAFDAFPDLRVVVQEAGVSWLPFLANRLNEIYYTQPGDVQLAERLFDRGQAYLERDPGDYLYDNFFFSTQPIALPPGGERATFELCRAESTFMYSSDWPHHTLDPVNWVFGPAVDDDLRARILRENARECYPL